MDGREFRERAANLFSISSLELSFEWAKFRPVLGTLKKLMQLVKNFQHHRNWTGGYRGHN